MRTFALVLLAATTSHALAAPYGWRMDGTGVADEATPPLKLDAGEQVVWKVETPSWSNATPIVVDGMVCITSEPTTLACYDAASGALKWQADHPVSGALEGPEKGRITTLVAEAQQAESELADARRAYSKLQREARRAASDPELSKRLADASAKLDKLKTLVDAGAPYRTPADKEIIGYASATPITDGTSIWVTFGNGVVARHALDGTTHWQRWLGTPPEKMRGYEFGQTASPRLAGDNLIVALGQLTALDADTGEVRWQSSTYDDYGTPAVLEVGGEHLVFTPRGEARKASNGEVHSKDLGELVYVGPVIDGQDVYYVGSYLARHGDASGSVRATALRVSSSFLGGDIQIEKRWSTIINTSEAVYAPPVIHKGLLYAVTKRGEIHVMNTSDGSSVYTQDLGDYLISDVFPGPTIASDRLYMLSMSGASVTATTGRSYSELHRGQMPPLRSTPVYQGNLAYVRTLEHLYALRGP